MKKIKTTNSDILLKERLKNKEFKKEYDALEEEFVIAKEIIKMRIAANLTQKELAEKAGTSQSAIARIESGSYENLSLASLRKIGKVFGTKPEIHFKKVKVS